MIKVNSSWIDGVQRVDNGAVVVIRGKEYPFRNISDNKFRNFVTAENASKFFAYAIRDNPNHGA